MVVNIPFQSIRSLRAARKLKRKAIAKRSGVRSTSALLLGELEHLLARPDHAQVLAGDLLHERRAPAPPKTRSPAAEIPRAAPASARRLTAPAGRRGRDRARRQPPPAPPRCGGAGCTWPCARPAPATPS